MPRTTTETTVDPNGTERHPSFGTMSLGTRSSTGTSLFQSDLNHQRTMVVQIHRAHRQRSNNTDHIHPEKTLVEVEMSMAQWGAFVSSTGLAAGVPVTLRQLPGEPVIPEAPHRPRLQANVDEVTGAVAEMLEELNEAVGQLSEAVEQKKGIRAIRSALGMVKNRLQNAPGNAGFAVKSLHRAAENTVFGARSDIEAHVLQTQNRIGQSSISLNQPALALPEAPQDLPGAPSDQHENQDQDENSPEA